MTEKRSENYSMVTLRRNGKILSAWRYLDEAALLAEGPMSLESGCMKLVRDLSQEIFSKMDASQ